MRRGPARIFLHRDLRGAQCGSGTYLSNATTAVEGAVTISWSIIGIAVEFLQRKRNRLNQRCSRANSLLEVKNIFRREGPS